MNKLQLLFTHLTQAAAERMAFKRGGILLSHGEAHSRTPSRLGDDDVVYARLSEGTVEPVDVVHDAEGVECMLIVDNRFGYPIRYCELCQEIWSKNNCAKPDQYRPKTCVRL